MLIRYTRAGDQGERGLRERIASTLQHCNRNYRDPQQFYEWYFYFFRSLHTTDYFSVTTTSRRGLLAEVRDGERILKTDGKLLPLTVKDIVNHYMGNALDRLREVAEEDWNAPQLQKVLQGVLDDTEPHAKMVDSEWRQKKLDFQLFLRWALIAGWSGPSNSVSMEILGKAISLQRLAKASTILPEQIQDL